MVCASIGILSDRICVRCSERPLTIALAQLDNSDLTIPGGAERGVAFETGHDTLRALLRLNVVESPSEGRYRVCTAVRAAVAKEVKETSSSAAPGQTDDLVEAATATETQVQAQNLHQKHYLGRLSSLQRLLASGESGAAMRIFDTERLNFDAVLLGDNAVTSETLDVHVKLSEESFDFHHMLMDRLSDTDIITYLARIREGVEEKKMSERIQQHQQQQPSPPSSGPVSPQRADKGPSPRRKLTAVTSPPKKSRSGPKIEAFELSQTQFRYYMNLERDLKEQQKQYGRVHPLVADTLDKMAQTLSSQGKDDSALQKYRQLLVVLEAVHGEAGHEKVGDACWCIGALDRKAGRLSEAKAAFSKTWEIYSQQLGENHPKTSAASAQLQYCLSGILKRAVRASTVTVRGVLGK